MCGSYNRFLALWLHENENKRFLVAFVLLSLAELKVMNKLPSETPNKLDTEKFCVQSVVYESCNHLWLRAILNRFDILPESSSQRQLNCNKNWKSFVCEQSFVTEEKCVFLVNTFCQWVKFLVSVTRITGSTV